MRDKIAKLAALAAVVCIVAIAAVFGDRKISGPEGVTIDSAAQCQEDEVYAWIANDVRGCVNYEEINN